MSFQLLRADARRLADHIAPASVATIICSPPYYQLRDYKDEDESLVGQIGNEPTPGEYIDSLVDCVRSWLPLLEPGGSIFVNLGDKRANDAKWGGATGGKHVAALHGATGIGRAKLRTGFPAKSLMGLPWRFAIRCVDDLGLILRSDMIWHKLNAMPESAGDRVKGVHEYLFHLTREDRYFASIDEIRQPHARDWDIDKRNGNTGYGRGTGTVLGRGEDTPHSGLVNAPPHPLGSTPQSVWTLANEPLTGVPAELAVEHYAAFPSELPRRCILGWTPNGYCLECGQGRRLHVVRMKDGAPIENPEAWAAPDQPRRAPTGDGGHWRFETRRVPVGYRCACPTPDAPTRPAVVLDPFVGTGTTVAVAHLLGRHGIGADLSAAYLRLAEWRTQSDLNLRRRVLDRSGIPNPKPPKVDGQLNLL